MFFFFVSTQAQPGSAFAMLKTCTRMEMLWDTAKQVWMCQGLGLGS